MLRKRNITKAVTIVALVLVTLLLHRQDVRYLEVRPDILTNRKFAEGLKGWRVSGAKTSVVTSDGFAELRGDRTTGQISLRQLVPVTAGDKAIRVEVEALTVGLARAGKLDIPALVMTVCQDQRGRSFYDSHSLFVSWVLPINTDGWRRYRGVVSIDRRAKSCSISVRLNSKGGGILRVRGFSMVPILEKPYWRTWSYVLLAVWGLTAIWISVSILKSVRRRAFRVWLVLGLLGVVVSSLVSYRARNSVGDWFSRQVSKLTGWSGSLGEVDLGADLPAFLQISTAKIGHIVMFLALTLIVRISWPHERLTTLAVYLGLFAAAVEVIQFFAFEREPRFTDWLLDGIGIMLGGLLAVVVATIYRQISRKASSKS